MKPLPVKFFPIDFLLLLPHILALPVGYHLILSWSGVHQQFGLGLGRVFEAVLRAKTFPVQCGFFLFIF